MKLQLVEIQKMDYLLPMHMKMYTSDPYHVLVTCVPGYYMSENRCVPCNVGVEEVVDVHPALGCHQEAEQEHKHQHAERNQWPDNY